MANATITIRVSHEMQDKLTRLAQGTRRSQSDLAAEAIAAYVQRELPIVEGIQRGLADVAAGRVIPHDEVMAQMHAIIDEAKQKRAATADHEQCLATLDAAITRGVADGEAGRVTPAEDVFDRLSAKYSAMAFPHERP
jgi:predicted transcriptional regulator